MLRIEIDLGFIDIWKTFDNCFVSFAGNSLPKELQGHAIVSIGDDIVVIGGFNYYDYDYDYYDDNNYNLYKLSCQNGNCQWTTLPQRLKSARSFMVAMAIPDDFFDCN